MTFVYIKHEIKNVTATVTTAINKVCTGWLNENCYLSGETESLVRRGCVLVGQWGNVATSGTLQNQWTHMFWCKPLEICSAFLHG